MMEETANDQPHGAREAAGRPSRVRGGSSALANWLAVTRSRKTSLDLPKAGRDGCSILCSNLRT